jgi:hypothetical protein
MKRIMKLHICPDGCMWSSDDLIYLAGLCIAAQTQKTRARRLRKDLVLLATKLKEVEGGMK